MYVLSILTFSCIPLLFNCFKSLKKIQIFQHKHIRHTHSIPWDDFISNITLHSDLNLSSTTQTIYNTFHKHYKKLNDRGQQIFYLLTPNSRLKNLFHNPPATYTNDYNSLLCNCEIIFECLVQNRLVLRHHFNNREMRRLNITLLCCSNVPHFYFLSFKIITNVPHVLFFVF